MSFDPGPDDLVVFDNGGATLYGDLSENETDDSYTIVPFDSPSWQQLVKDYGVVDDPF